MYKKIRFSSNGMHDECSRYLFYSNNHYFCFSNCFEIFSNEDVSQTTVSSMAQVQEPSSNITIARPILVMPVLARPILPPRLYWLIVRSQNRTTSQMEMQKTTPSSLSS
jgi:hypothetical protein